MTVRVISYGGGVQSTAMLVLAARKEIDFPVAIFANTGDDSEHPASIAYVRDVAIPYAQTNGIDLQEIQRHKRDGSVETLYGRLMSPSPSIGIPVRMNTSGAPGNRNCTIDFKIRPIAKELKRLGATAKNPAIVALGISVDEYQRMRSDSGIPHEVLTYPLIDRRMDRSACIELIKREGLPVPGKSSCWFCPYHSIANWRKQLKTEPELFERSAQLEETINARRAVLGKGSVWLTGRLIPLREAVTENGQMDLFAPSCDIGGYCHA